MRKTRRSREALVRPTTIWALQGQVAAATPAAVATAVVSFGRRPDGPHSRSQILATDLVFVRSWQRLLDHRSPLMMAPTVTLRSALVTPGGVENQHVGSEIVGGKKQLRRGERRVQLPVRAGAGPVSVLLLLQERLVVMVVPLPPLLLERSKSHQRRRRRRRSLRSI